MSVIIPVLDREGYIAESIDSVLGQDHEPVEVIVVDGPSTDRTPEIVRSRPVTYLRRETLGISVALNQGLAHAKGELITFNDSDDVWLPRKLASQTEYLAEHPEVDMVASGMELFDEPGAEPASWMRLDARRPGDVIVHKPTWMWRRRALERVGMFDTTLEGSEDADWLARARDARLRSPCWRNRWCVTECTRTTS